jgi:prepilin-type N-terminal cleavage/methylation domain-containing protein
MKKVLLLKQNKGVTLVEMILAVTLIAVVVSLGYMFYFTGFKAFDRNVDRVDLQQNVRHSLSFISRLLLNANNANVEAVAIEAAPDMLYIRNERNGQIEAFRLIGTTLSVNYDYLNLQSPFNPLAEGITEFESTRSGNMITLTISAGTEQQNDHFTLSTQVLLRR